MRIPIALLADFAVAHEDDGKLYVTGGGIRELRFPVFPGTQARLALALGIEVPADALGKPHTLTIEVTGPTPESIVKPITRTFVVARGKDSSRPGYIHVISNMENISFPREGDYTFQITIDGEAVERLGLRASLSGEEESAEQEANRLLSEGYGAFAHGDVPGAEAIFRDVVARFPTVPGGHNNLGFVLLSKGEAAEALRAFLAARDLGYGLTEFSYANIACAIYVIGGDHKLVFEIFDRCLRQERFRERGILFVITGSRLFPVQLFSAADYASLITLNAAWAALRTGDRARMTELLEAARVMVLARRDDDGGRKYVDSIHALEREGESQPASSS